MPYIRQSDRPKIDAFLNPLIEHLKTYPPEKLDGRTNYVIFRMLLEIYGKTGSRNYYDMNRGMGVLSCVGKEFYRIFFGPFEDMKSKENGEIQ